MSDIVQTPTEKILVRLDATPRAGFFVVTAALGPIRGKGGEEFTWATCSSTLRKCPLPKVTGQRLQVHVGRRHPWDGDHDACPPGRAKRGRGLRKCPKSTRPGLFIGYDHYGSTNSPMNEKLCGEFWAAFRKAGMVREADVTQLFDPQEGIFLADRFVKGTCPKCGAEDQYGDSCEVCQATYSPADLVNPVSALSGATPEKRVAKHLFVDIEREHEFLETWTKAHLQESVANYLAGHFLSAPLRDWDVSRPAPYFGFEIPDSPGNYWYVWFDAPIGYIASTAEWCEKNGASLDDWWRSKDTEIVHIIGKDITYFHTLFWPVMLKTAGFSLPENPNPRLPHRQRCQDVQEPGNAD